MTTTEAPYSFNVKAIDRNGYDAMFTIRDEDGQQFFRRVTNLLNWLPANGYTPTSPRRSPQAHATNGNAPAAAPANVPVCPTHGPMVPSKKHAGFYCPKKLFDGNYCQSKAEAQPTAAQAATVANVVASAPLIAAAPMPQAQAVVYATPPPATSGTPPPPDFDQYYNDQN